MIRYRMLEQHLSHTIPNHLDWGPITWSTLFLHGDCMLRECIYGECAHEQHVRRTLTLTHTITAYSVRKMSYVCAYASVQLDNRRVEKEFTE